MKGDYVHFLKKNPKSSPDAEDTFTDVTIKADEYGGKTPTSARSGSALLDRD